MAAKSSRDGNAVEAIKIDAFELRTFMPPPATIAGLP
jgi:hypothetical protein